jgi:uncharacterized protein (TIGR02217 family)
MTLPIFPALPGITWPITRSAAWATLRQEAISGLETRLQLWTYPRYKYQLPIEVLRAAASFSEMQTLEAFYNSVGGPAGVFLYADPNDGTATHQGFGTGDGSTTVFQLVRGLGGFTAPVFAATPVAVQVAGIDVTSSVYAGTAPGTIHFSTPPAAGAPLTWWGPFWWPCRFDDDQMEFQQDFSTVWSLKACKFSTVKL